ncbi:WecB/TagA/CpsF family glycosyltransferase [Corynebacterium anserum]|uniref:WecB/TagA/CpsF family glycosyltransferase n=1 Tax=Corynebacterium anserum TaxID=2684406 RepID=A0A7G7YQK6_9CORY|nr:WecB/TagA/CpsF family glycosyltransferase [Corynebacterium anserum]MBC2682469.1 WecB/TagA/CpsF family glycosyltransferase [Corynebacterium anserum]QNH96776.1 WecB/TagA/CpsF family glycosyltransferase [Corynebacterium anserum]
MSVTSVARLLQQFNLLTVDRSSSKAEILGRPVFPGTAAEAVSLFLSETPSTPKLVITPNVDHINRLVLDAQWREVFQTAEILLTDGKPVEILLKKLGADNIHRITGADLLPRVATAARGTGKRIAVVGGRDDVRQQAIANLTESNGQELDIVGVSVPFAPGGFDEAAQRIVELQPDIVFVCLSSPKQEQWVEDFREVLPGAWYIGSGAAVDFAAGEVERAPEWMQNLSLEWVYRLMKEPKRLAYRYVVVGPLFLGVIASAMAHRQRVGK